MSIFELKKANQIKLPEHRYGQGSKNVSAEISLPAWPEKRDYVSKILKNNHKLQIDNKKAIAFKKEKKKKKKLQKK